MKPFPDDEWRLLQPLDGVLTMLELGNKKNPDGVYKAGFESLGIRHTSIDWNGQDGALKLDLTKPLGLGEFAFDMVTNFGTTEHVAQQEPCWLNIHEAVKVGGLLISMTPHPGDWWWHGDWYPTDDFYRAFAKHNGYTVERLYIDRETPRRNWYCRMRKNFHLPFVMPTGMLYRNQIRAW